MQSHGSAAFRGISLALIINQAMSGHTGPGSSLVAARVRTCADGVGITHNAWAGHAALQFVRAGLAGSRVLWHRISLPFHMPAMNSAG